MSALAVRIGEQFRSLSRRTVAIYFTGTVIVLAYLITSTMIFAPTPLTQVYLSYDQFKQQLESGNVSSIISTGRTGDLIEGETHKGVKDTNSSSYGTEFRTIRPAFDDTQLAGLLASHTVAINATGSFAWDLVNSSVPFSTLAAVLAGFVFIAIIGILTIPPNRSERPSLPLLALVQAFLTLVVASFLFAVLAGRTASTSSSLTGLSEFLITWILALGVVQTCVGVAWVLEAYGLERAVVQAGTWIVLFAIGLAATSTAGVLVTPLYNFFPNRIGYDDSAWAVATGPVIIAVLLAVRWSGRNSRDYLYRLTLPALGGVIAVSILFGIMTGLSVGSVRRFYPVVFGVFLAAQLALDVMFVLYARSMPSIAPERLSRLGRLAQQGGAETGSENST